MYARYRKTRQSDRTSYQFIERCSLFGCNNGCIPLLLRQQSQRDQVVPSKWHLAIESALNLSEYRGTTLVIDLKPKQTKTNLSLYEILDVWGYSDSTWTPILLHLSGLFVDTDPAAIDRNQFTIADADRDEPIYEFMYLEGGIVNGQLTGRWTAPPVSPTNSALLWPDPLAYFVHCIRQRTPQVLPF